MADQNINIKLLIDAADAAKSVGETKKALRDLKTAAMSVEEGSQAFNDLNTAAGQLQDRIGDLAATTKYLGDDLKNLKGFTSIASGIAGAFAAAQGAAALFSGENKQLEESILKVQSAMGVLQGIQAVGEVLQKESAASLFIQNGLRTTAIALTSEQAVAEAAEAVAAGTATLAQRALNSAMNANPILALVSLLAVATAALYAFSSSSEKSTKETEKAKKASEDRTKALEEEKKSYSDYIGKEMAGYQTLATQLAQSNPKSQERLDLIKKINETYGTTIKNLSDEKMFQDQVAKSIETYIGFLKQKYALQSQQKTIEESFGKQAALERELLDLTIQRGVQQSILNGKQTTTYRDIDVKTTPEYQQLQQIDKVIKQKQNQKLVEEGVVKSAVQNSITLSKSIEDSGLKISSETAKTSKKVVDTAEKTADKLAEINLEYQKALAELVIETNDNLLEQEALLLSVSGESEANLIAQERLDTEVKITTELQNQQNELQKLVDIKVKELEATTGKTATTSQISNIKTAIQQGAEYQNYLKSSNAIVVGITTQGEQAIYDIQKDYAEKRRKLLEETTKRVLATDEYKRFIDFLNNARQMEMKLSEYQKTFGKDAVEILKYDKEIQDSNKSYREELELTIKTEEALLASKQRNVEEQKKINKELVEGGMVTQQEVDKAITEIEALNVASNKKIAAAKEFLKEDPQQTKIQAKGKDFSLTETIPQNAIADLEKYYQKYKGNVEGLFDLSRKSNLNQLGENQKSIEILSALYGEKYNIIKNGEDEINKVLAESGVKFGIDPKEGEIGLKALIELTSAESKTLSDAQKTKVQALLEGNKEIKGLNQELLDNYKKVSDEEQKYFEKATFENYTNQQQKLTDNKAAYAAGEISKREFDKKNLEIDKEFNDSEANLKQNHEENLLAIGVVYGEKSQADIVEFGKNRKSEKEKQAEEEKAIEDKKNAYLIQAGQSLYNTLRSFADATMQDNLNRIQEEQDLRLAAIDAELLDFDNRDKQISAAEQAKIDERKVIEDKRAAVKAEYDKKVRDEKIKQFNIQKAMDIIQIGINTAIAVSASLAPPLLPMVPFIVAAGAAEAFFVAAQQPNFADGGLVTGPGGPKDDMVKANLSNGEVVINAKSSKKYAGILNAINQAGGGKPIPFKDGGLVASPMSTSDNTNMEDFKSLILDIVNRPIETYVKESSITNAQKSQSTQSRRTSF